jgi:hypothetical protein
MEGRINRALIQGTHNHPLAAGNVRAGSFESMRTRYNPNTGEPQLVFQIEERKSDGSVANYWTAIATGDLIAKVQELQWQEVEVLAEEVTYNRQTGKTYVFPSEVTPVAK